VPVDGQQNEGGTVAKQSGNTNSVYKVVDLVGTSTQSWEDAAKNAVETAGSSLRDLRIAEVVKMDVTVKDGKVQSYRTRVQLSFKYEH
jgi:flavin-binding protein dodecin